jgi:hypothetical protein
MVRLLTPRNASRTVNCACASIDELTVPSGLRPSAMFFDSTLPTKMMLPSRRWQAEPMAQVQAMDATGVRAIPNRSKSRFIPILLIFRRPQASYGSLKNAKPPEICECLTVLGK